MRIGIDFDNTIICYDQVFCNLAQSWQLVEASYQGSKSELKARIQALPDGDLVWQKLQGKACGELINQAEMFAGFKDFIAACNADKNIEVFIVSHKTEFGHFDEKRISLRDASRQWLREQGFFTTPGQQIPETNVFFETTREEKIERIKELKCTHFIDDLIEVLGSPLFPNDIERYLFQSQLDGEHAKAIKSYSNWADIKNVIFKR
jgi:hypothetical protein